MLGRRAWCGAPTRGSCQANNCSRSPRPIHRAPYWRREGVPLKRCVVNRPKKVLTRGPLAPCPAGAPVQLLPRRPRPAELGGRQAGDAGKATLEADLYLNFFVPVHVTFLGVTIVSQAKLLGGAGLQ